ncbi:MAG: hypothetical protein Q8O41_00155, partial [Candidatus Methanoperedens sp.]|nr:hypothetical protein [Candidatus Methanoperedens sp.]
FFFTSKCPVCFAFFLVLRGTRHEPRFKKRGITPSMHRGFYKNTGTEQIFRRLKIIECGQETKEDFEKGCTKIGYQKQHFQQE